MTILNITNGDSAVDVMQEGQIAGDFLPWRDVLHDGPVPKTENLDALSLIRAQFISDCGWAALDETSQGFIKRDNTLKNFQHYDKVILWFEHDLYDQLQLIQLLDWFNQQPAHNTPISIICTEQYLGMLSANEISDLVQFEQAITLDQMALGSKAWDAFQSSHPKKWQSLLDSDLSSLPFLKNSVLRLLEEFPSCFNGLSRIEQQALSIIASGEKKPFKIFELNQQKEDAIYLGDYSFWLILNNLLKANPALITSNKGHQIHISAPNEHEISISDYGKKVLTGQKNFLDSYTIDRWIGGTHLSHNNIWCWDSKKLSKG